MSVTTEITRITELRNAIRDDLKILGVLESSSASLADCSVALSGIENKGAVNGVISAKEEKYTVAAGYHNGSGSVGIVSSEQEKIIADNIKRGVTILGVAGSYQGDDVLLQSKNVAPSKSAQTVTADSGYDGLSSVIVEAIPTNFADVSGVTVAAGDVLATKIFVSATGAEVAGTMLNNGAISQTINGTTITSYTIPAGYHSGGGTVSLDDTIETALAAI